LSAGDSIPFTSKHKEKKKRKKEKRKEKKKKKKEEEEEENETEPQRCSNQSSFGSVTYTRVSLRWYCTHV
jgi:hypothetical protein